MMSRFLYEVVQVRKASTKWFEVPLIGEGRVHDLAKQRRFVKVKHLEKRRDVSIVLRNKPLQETNKEVRCHSASVDLAPVGYHMSGV